MLKILIHFLVKPMKPLKALIALDGMDEAALTQQMPIESVQEESALMEMM